MTHRSHELEQLDHGRVEQVVLGAVAQKRLDQRLEEVTLD